VVRLDVRHPEREGPGLLRLVVGLAKQADHRRVALQDGAALVAGDDLEGERGPVELDGRADLPDRQGHQILAGDR
jgi:hypothetical protein